MKIMSGSEWLIIERHEILKISVIPGEIVGMC